MKNDYRKANEQLQEYARLKSEKAEKDAEMKEIFLDLKEFAEKNPNLFDEKGTLEMGEDGKLRWATKTTLVKEKKFSPAKFFGTFRQLCDLSIPMAGIKRAFADPDLSKLLTREGLSLKDTEEFKVDV